MIHDIHHSAISTPDFDRALRFYSDLIGFEVERAFEIDRVESVDEVLALTDVHMRVAILRLGDTRLELFEFRNPDPQRSDPNRPVCDHGITHICLRVTDIEREYERLRAAGMRFHCPPSKGRGLTATYGRDPDGNVIELLEMH